MIEKTFTLEEIAAVNQKSRTTLQNHINRKLLIGTGPRASFDKPAGKHARFSFNTLMQFALAYELVDLGLQLEVAFRAAGDFAHTASGPLNGLPDRLPGLPYHHSHGVTVFAASCERSTEELWVPKGGRDTFGNLRHRLGDKFVVVDASALFDRLCARLVQLHASADWHPNLILDGAYPEDGGA